MINLNQEHLKDLHNTYSGHSYGGLIAKSEDPGDGDSNWLITLSDVFTLLLVFMIVFLVMTKQTTGSVTAKELETGRDHGVHAKRIIDTGIRMDIVSRLEHLGLGDEVSVQVGARDVVVIMREKVTFMPGEADVLQDSVPLLERIADIMNAHPELNVEISGHTDNVPIGTSQYPSNWELSVARATSVLKYFIHHHHIDSSRLSIKGNADQRPVARNDTPENRAKNRRVEIKFSENNV